MKTIKKVKTPAKTNPKAKSVVNIKKISPKTPGVPLDSFSVTHDSIVATMTLVVTKDHRRIKIWWGDESQYQQPETIFVGGIRDIQQPIFGGEALPENTYKLQHGYDENAPKRKIILVQIKDKKNRVTWETAVIEIDPKYKFIAYPVTIEGKEHLDSFFESDSEFKIDMMVTHNQETLLNKHWELDIKTDDPPFSFRLDESGFKTEISYSDDPIYIQLHITEDDDTFFKILGDLLPPVEFDTSIPYYFFPFHPKLYKGSQEFRDSISIADDGSIDVVLNLEMNLIVPFNRVRVPQSTLI